MWVLVLLLNLLGRKNLSAIPRRMGADHGSSSCTASYMKALTSQGQRNAW